MIHLQSWVGWTMEYLFRALVYITVIQLWPRVETRSEQTRTHVRRACFITHPTRPWVIHGRIRTRPTRSIKLYIVNFSMGYVSIGGFRKCSYSSTYILKALFMYLCWFWFNGKLQRIADRLYVQRDIFQLNISDSALARQKCAKGSQFVCSIGKNNNIVQRQ